MNFLALKIQRYYISSLRGLSFTIGKNIMRIFDLKIIFKQGKKMIVFMLLISRHGKTRLNKYYKPFNQKERQTI